MERTRADPINAAEEAVSVRQAGAHELRALTRATALAFYEDPHMRWVMPDDAQRLAQLERGFAAGLRGAWLRHEACYTTAGVVGGAFWLPPGEEKLGVARMLRLLPAMLAAYRSSTPRVLRALAFLERMHPREPHWYLAVLGVKPAWQRRGLGTALMKAILDRCDREGTPAFLEASTARSRACYERQGFEVMSEFRLCGEGPTGWQMWRRPRRLGAGEAGAVRGSSDVTLDPGKAPSRAPSDE